MQKNSNTTGPLSGLRVLELGQMIAVPAATHILAGYGAEVIKVEDTTAGDGLRYFGSKKNGMSGWFVNANWGKRSIAVDLKSQMGKDVLWSLLETADVFIEGYRFGVMARLGFSYEAVKARNPEIIYCASSGFGPDGPYADRPVYDPLIQGLSGWAGMQMHNGEPTLVRAMVADKIGAYANAQAIMAAVIQRHQTGQGCLVQSNMLESNLAFVWSDTMMDCTLLDDDVQQLPNLLTSYRLYPCADGLVAIAPGTDQHWQSMCDVLQPDVYADERFHSSAGRGEHSQEWMDTIERMVKPYPAATVVERLQGAEVPAAPVMNPHDVHTDPHVQATGMLIESMHPVVGNVRHPRPAAHYLGIELELIPAPKQGEHTTEILKEIGFNDLQVAELVDLGHVRASQ
ncbi:MAG: CaiB/BaiF CoA transferase family protein [Pseudomonadales bacterium]